MAYRKKTPEGGKVLDRWQFVTTRAKEPWTGWVAGPCEWFQCHRNPQSKPCVFCFTDGEMKCARCTDGWQPYWWGYLPIYRESDGKPCLVGLHECSFDLASGLERLQHVRLLRGNAVTDGVGVFPTGGARYKLSRPDRFHAPDLYPWLFRLWKMPELHAWWLANNKGHDDGDGRCSLPGGAGTGGASTAAADVVGGPAGGADDLPDHVVREVMRQRAAREVRTLGEMNGFHRRE